MAAGGVKGERCPRPIEFQREISSLCLGRGGRRKKQKLWFGEVGEKKKRPNKRKEKTASCHFMNLKQKETKNDSDQKEKKKKKKKKGGNNNWRYLS